MDNLGLPAPGSIAIAVLTLAEREILGYTQPRMEGSGPKNRGSRDTVGVISTFGSQGRTGGQGAGHRGKRQRALDESLLKGNPGVTGLGVKGVRDVTGATPGEVGGRSEVNPRILWDWKWAGPVKWEKQGGD